MTTAPIIRITSDGAWRTTDATGGGFPATGSVRITGLEDVPEFDVDSAGGMSEQKGSKDPKNGLKNRDRHQSNNKDIKGA